MRKKIGLMVIMAMLAAAFFVTDSSAQVAGYVCTVQAAGPGLDGTYIQMTSAPAFTGKWFIAPASVQKEMLAVALTAMNNEMNVFLYVDLNAGAFPPIQAFYLLR